MQAGQYLSTMAKEAARSRGALRRCFLSNRLTGQHRFMVSGFIIHCSLHCHAVVHPQKDMFDQLIARTDLRENWNPGLGIIRRECPPGTLSVRTYSTRARRYPTVPCSRAFCPVQLQHAESLHSSVPSSPSWNRTALAKPGPRSSRTLLSAHNSPLEDAPCRATPRAVILFLHPSGGTPGFKIHATRVEHGYGRALAGPRTSCLSPTLVIAPSIGLPPGTLSSRRGGGQQVPMPRCRNGQDVTT